ncbi:MAG TPA: PAS domain S-box protein, partial [Thermoanaerobaculia bacterium]|nr:PAS domain S-box protein [Thermoanaerobaculia bacterium]
MSGSKPTLRSRITLYGSPLTIGVSPTPSLLADLSSPLPETVLVSGLLVSCLLALALALHFAHGARRRARALLAEREDLRQTEKALRESEEVFRTMFEASSVGIARTDPEGRFLLTNAAYRRMLGYSAAEMDRLTVEEVTHPNDWPRNRELFQRLINREIPSFQIEKRYRRKDGSEIWVHNSVSAVFDAADRPLFAQAVSQDVSEVKRAGEALRAGEAKYRLLAEHASDLITQFTPEGEITYASPAAERMLGFRPEELIDRHAREFIHPEDLERVAESRRSLLRGEKVTDTVEFRLRRKSGEYLWAESASQAIWDPNSSRADSVISATRDITESVRATQRNRLLQGITAAANQSPTAERAMQTALELICEHTGWPVGHASMMARDARGEMASTDVWKVQEPAHFDRWRRIMEGMRSAGAGLLERVLASGQAAWIEDTTQEAGFQAAADGGIRAVFAFPVRSGDTTLAVLEFFSPDSVSHDERLMEVMNDIGLQLGQMVRRQRSEKALAASEMRFRTLAGTAHDAIFIADERGRIVYCNEGIEQIFGYECDELVGQALTVLMPERFHAPYTEGLARFLETREPSIMGRPIEMSGRRKDGSEIPVEMVLSWWESEEGVFFTGILRDV